MSRLISHHFIFWGRFFYAPQHFYTTMTYKILNALRKISILLLVIVFFIAYAALPEQVLVLLDGKGYPSLYLNRDVYFYGIVALLILTNLLIYVLGAFIQKTSVGNSRMAMHIIALPIVLNVFFMVSLTFIGILNGQENFDYASYRPIMYVSMALFLAWLVSLLVSFAKQKKLV